MPTQTLTKEERRAPQSLLPRSTHIEEEEVRGAVGGGLVEREEATTYLTGNDLAGTAVAALVVLAYGANAQDWWYLGSNRWAAVTMVAVGAIGCPLGARLVGEDLSSLPIVLLASLGVGALVLAVLAIVTAAHWALLALAIVVVALWAGATLRHAITPPQRLARQ